MADSAHRIDSLALSNFRDAPFWRTSVDTDFNIYQEKWWKMQIRICWHNANFDLSAILIIWKMIIWRPCRIHRPRLCLPWAPCNRCRSSYAGRWWRKSPEKRIGSLWSARDGIFPHPGSTGSPRLRWWHLCLPIFRPTTNVIFSQLIEPWSALIKLII